MATQRATLAYFKDHGIRRARPYDARDAADLRAEHSSKLLRTIQAKAHRGKRSDRQAGRLNGDLRVTRGKEYLQREEPHKRTQDTDTPVPCALSEEVADVQRYRHAAERSTAGCGALGFCRRSLYEIGRKHVLRNVTCTGNQRGSGESNR